MLTSILIGDHFLDMDDLLAEIVRQYFITMQLMEYGGTIVNHGSQKTIEQRASQLVTSLKLLGVSSPIVATGIPVQGKDFDCFPMQYVIPTPWSSTTGLKGEQLFLETLKQANDQSIAVSLMSRMTDFAHYLEKAPKLIKTKVAKVAIMGGVKSDGSSLCLENGLLVPDIRASNVKFDPQKAAFVYEQCQDLGIPTITVSRHAAAATKVGLNELYFGMAATGNVLGLIMLQQPYVSLQDLWERVQLGPDDPGRKDLPAPCTVAWFRKRFANGDKIVTDSAGGPWPSVTHVNLYDVLTVMVMTPWFEVFFEPYVHTVANTQHSVIGINAEETGIQKPKELAKFMLDIILMTLFQTGTNRFQVGPLPT